MTLCAVLPAIARPLLESGLPGDIAVDWFTTAEEADAMIAHADIAWVDMQDPERSAATAMRGGKLRWLFTLRAGIDAYDTAALAKRGTVLTNGAGINANAVAEYAVLGILAAAKRFDRVVLAAAEHRWFPDAPGKVELEGSAALVIGMGRIGGLIADRLTAFGVAVTGVTRSGRDGTLGPAQWRDRLGAFDWIVLAAPSTGDTQAMIGAAELAAFRPCAWLVNIARGDMVDQAALVDALAARRIGGAFLDTVEPEPLPAEHPLWSAPNAIVTMHLSGRSQTRMFARAAALFLRNLSAFREGRPLENVVDLAAGY